MFQTANGSTSTSDVAKIVVDELDETVEPHVLDEDTHGIVSGEEMHEDGLCISLDAW